MSTLASSDRADRPAVTGAFGLPDTFSARAQWFHEGPGYGLARALGDAVMLACAVVIAHLIDPHRVDAVKLLFPLLTMAILAQRRMYDPAAQISALDRMAIVVGATAVATLLVAGLVALAFPPTRMPLSGSTSCSLAPC